MASIVSFALVAERLAGARAAFRAAEQDASSSLDVAMVIRWFAATIFLQAALTSLMSDLTKSTLVKNWDMKAGCPALFPASMSADPGAAGRGCSPTGFALPIMLAREAAPL